MPVSKTLKSLGWEDKFFALSIDHKKNSESNQLLKDIAIEEGWLTLFSQMISQGSNNIFSKHVGADSSYKEKEALLAALKLIYAHLAQKLDQKLMPLSQDNKDAIKEKLLEEDANECTHGFHLRVNQIISGFFQPQNFSDLLFRLRMGIVARAALTSGTTEIHTNNQFYIAAKVIDDFGVLPILESDIYKGTLDDEDIQTKLKNQYKKDLTLYRVVQLIIMEIKSVMMTYGYRGYQELSYTLAEFNAFFSYLKKFLGDDTLEYEALFCMTDHKFNDIHWLFIEKKITNKLLDENYYTSQEDCITIPETEIYPKILFKKEASIDEILACLHSLTLSLEAIKELFFILLRSFNQDKSEAKMNEILLLWISHLYQHSTIENKLSVFLCHLASVNSLVLAYLIKEPANYSKNPEILLSVYFIYYSQLTSEGRANFLKTQSKEMLIILEKTPQAQTEEALEFSLNHCKEDFKDVLVNTLIKEILNKTYVDDTNFLLSLNPFFILLNLSYVKDKKEIWFNRYCDYFKRNCQLTILVAFFSTHQNFKIIEWVLKIIRTFPTDQQIAIFKQCNEGEWNALMTAAMFNATAIKLLLDIIKTFKKNHQISLFKQYSLMGWNAVMTAVKFNPTAVELFLEIIKTFQKNHQIFIFKQCSHMGWNAVMLAVRSNLTATRLLLEIIKTFDQYHQIAIFKKFSDCGNALMIAARYDSKAVELLLEIIKTFDQYHQIAILKKLNDYGWNALMLAARYQPAAVEPLLKIIRGFKKEDKDSILMQCINNNSYQHIPGFSRIIQDEFPEKERSSILTQHRDIFFSYFETLSPEEKKITLNKPSMDVENTLTLIKNHPDIALQPSLLKNLLKEYIEEKKSKSNARFFSFTRQNKKNLEAAQKIQNIMGKNSPLDEELKILLKENYSDKNLSTLCRLISTCMIKLLSKSSSDMIKPLSKTSSDKNINP